jgi:hypothetical protein
MISTKEGVHKSNPRVGHFRRGGSTLKPIHEPTHESNMDIN